MLKVHIMYNMFGHPNLPMFTYNLLILADTDHINRGLISSYSCYNRYFCAIFGCAACKCIVPVSSRSGSSVLYPYPACSFFFLDPIPQRMLPAHHKIAI